MMIGNRFIETLTFFLLLFSINGLIFAGEISRDVLRLKDGSTVRGFILEKTPDGHLKIQTKGSVAEYKMTEITSIDKEMITVRDGKSPVLALVLCVVPGVGQYYNGQILKGLVIDGLYLSGLEMIVLSLRNPNYSSDGYLNVADSGLNALGGSLWLGGWLFSIVDAPISAADINGQREKDKFMESASSFNQPLTLGMNLGYWRNSSINMLPGGSVSLRF